MPDGYLVRSGTQGVSTAVIEISSTLHTTVYTVSALASVSTVSTWPVSQASRPRSMTSLFPVASSFSIRATRSCPLKKSVPSPRVLRS